MIKSYFPSPPLSSFLMVIESHESDDIKVCRLSNARGKTEL